MISPVIHSRKRKAFSGCHIEKGKTYEITLKVVHGKERDGQLYLMDLNEPCDFAGWISYREGRSQRRHRFVNRFCRVKNAKVFSLIGQVGEEKIDFGKLWLEAGKQSFKINFSEYEGIKADTEKLYVYVNDVKFFYWNNRGGYQMTVEEVR